MLTDEQIEALMDAAGIPNEGREIIRKSRSSEPDRRVASSRIAGNVSGTFPSRKMGRTIQFESHSIERHAIVAKYENDPDCLEYWDQPFLIESLVYEGKNGRKSRSKHTPDFLVIMKNGFFVDEWKPEHKLLDLEKKGGSRFTFDKDGRWRFLAAEEWCAIRGLSYRVRLDKDLNRVLVQNIEYLQDYLHPKAVPPSPEKAESIKGHIRLNPWVSLGSLLRLGVGSADDILYMISRGDLLANIEGQFLHETDNAYVYRSPEDMEIHKTFRSEETSSRVPAVLKRLPLEEGSPILWDGKPWIVANWGEGTVTLTSGSILMPLPRDQFDRLYSGGAIKPVEWPMIGVEDLIPEYLQRPPEAYREALRRMEILDKIARGETLSPDEVKDKRTYKRWRARMRKSKAALGWELAGLLPDISFRGNRGSRVGSSNENLARQAIEAIKTPDRKGVQFAYQSYAIDCEKEGEIPMSEKSFMKRMRQDSRKDFVECREGHKVAYQVGGFVPAFERDPFRHGVHPWDFAHIDHTQVPLFLESSIGLEWKEKPWLTLIIATQCRRVLGFYLTFDPPSYVSCMMALREVIRCFGRLPRTIVVDGGKDFRSTDFEVFLARCESGKKTRPPHQPRFGSMVESALGLTIEQLFNNLDGNSQATRERTMTESTDPRNRIRYTLSELHAVLQHFFYKVYDQSAHSGIGCSPKEAYENGLKIGGARDHIVIPWNQEILYLSSPSVPGGTRKVTYRKGIEVFGIDYYSYELDANGVPDSKVDVKYDPDNAGQVFVYANNRWIRCLSEHHQVFARWTVKEVALASATLRKKEQSKRMSRGERMKNLVRYLQSGECQDELKERREKAVETALSTPELRMPRQHLPVERPMAALPDPKSKANKKTSAPPVKFERIVYGRFKNND